MNRVVDIWKKQKWRRTGAVALIICILGSIVLSNQISGVQAVTDEERDLWNDAATPSDAKHTPDDADEDEWVLASGSNASVSNASPSNAEEYEQQTLEDDSEPVWVSGKLPIGTSLKAEVVTEDELQNLGLEELELDSGRPVFAYDISLWLHGQRYEPEYALTVQIDNMELLGGDLKLIQLEPLSDSEQPAEPVEIACDMDKEGRIRFTMKQLALYVGVDMSDPDAVVTIEDEQKRVSVTGILPKGTTVTAEPLSEEILSQLQLPEGDVTFAYDITLWTDGKEYQPEHPVKVKVLNAKDEYHEELLITHVKVDEEGEPQAQNSISSDVETDGSASFLADSFSYFIGSARQTELQLGTVTWKQSAGAVTVQGDGTDPGELNVALLDEASENVYTNANSAGKTVMFAYSISANGATTESSTGVCKITVADCGIMSDDGSIEIYKIANETATSLGLAEEVQEGSLSFLTTGLGNYIAVSNVVTVDLAKGAVTIKADSLAGTRQDGRAVDVAFGKTDAEYRITQDNASRTIFYGITAQGTFSKKQSIILDSINTTGAILINGSKETKILTLLLRGTNQVARISYGTGNQFIEHSNTESGLTIDSYASHESTDGELYIPRKMNSRQEIVKYVSTGVENDGELGPAWALAGIGGYNGDWSCATGLTISGGTICVLTSKANCATAIGGGGNADAEVTITGGDITAICCGTGAAIGGGIGWVNRGGNGKVTITGGTVYAENYGYYTRNNIDYGGVAIGSGSSMAVNGDAADIEISGNTHVTAYARYGNGIGSGNSYKGTAAEATIEISGNSYVMTNALGGGTSKGGKGGSAEIAVSENATVECVNYSNVTDRYDDAVKNELDAFGIGGGGSRGDADGGSAVLTISGGSVSCNGGKIGGGSAENGKGGDASVTITGGSLDCASIGGGDSENGTPGAVTGSDSAAGVVIEGGTIRTGTIDGGTNTKGDLGFATAKITGGEIQGQFVLANSDPAKTCSFVMKGGTIDNQNLKGSAYARARENGGAVYLDDANGTVEISGGIIKNASGVLGGAVYMNAGTFKLSGNGVIENCSAELSATNEGGCGGAVYLAAGTVEMSGGIIKNNQSENDGAGIYLANGSLNVSDGRIENNTAQRNGGGAYLQSGTFTLGSDVSSQIPVISGNHAVDGAGVYLAGGTPNLNCGTLSGNIASGNGGGIYIDRQKVTLTPAGAVSVTGNNADNGAGIFIAGTAGERNASFTLAENCKGSIALTGNTATGHGGAICIQNGSFAQASDKITITGNKASYGGGVAVLEGDVNLSGGTIGSENGANAADKDGGGVYVSGGTVTLDGGAVKYNTARINGGGISVEDGNVLVYQGSITNNKTSGGAGGGMYVNASQKEADLVVLSGIISDNRSHTSGGAIAVQSDSGKTINVVIGTKQEHEGWNSDGGRKFTGFPFPYSGAYSSHSHTSCPVVSGNEAGDEGGAFYVNSGAAQISIYCLHETGNKADGDSRSQTMKVEGGTVAIGDTGYENINEAVKGNVSISGSMLVQGGTVTVWGDMKNPYFQDRITVDSQDGYIDNRLNSTVEYRVLYKENFTGTGKEPTGLYIAKQYGAQGNVTIDGSVFVHGGWTIQEWNTRADGTGTGYTAGKSLFLQEMNLPDHTLTLYAIWTRNMYTVVFHPNIPLGVSYSGSMSNMPCTVGEAIQLPSNQYACIGYQFDGWSTKMDGSGDIYSDGQSLEKGLSQENGATVNLYAKWSVCQHSAEKLTYTINEEKDGLIESCSCKAHTAEVVLSAVNGTYDGQAQLAKLSYKGDSWSGAQLLPEYSWRNIGSTEVFQRLTEGAEPVKAGQYRARISAGTGSGQAETWCVYTIAKAAQKEPEGALTYDYNADEGILTISPISTGAEADDYHRIPVYEIAYESNSVSYNQTQKDGENPNKFTIPGTLPADTYCRISAYYAETDNYLASPALDAGFYINKNVSVHFTMDPGITVEPANAPEGSTVTGTVKWYEVKIDDGYHKHGFQYSSRLGTASGDSGLFKKYSDSSSESGELYYLSIPTITGTDSSEIQVSLTGVIQNASIGVKQNTGSFFDEFDGAEKPAVGADSSFTAQFDVTGRTKGEYTNPSLTFESEVPKGTAIIMQTIGENAAPVYWYYKVAETSQAGTSLELSNFLRMGTSVRYTDVDADKMSYRFILDFSDVDAVSESSAAEIAEGTAWKLGLQFEKAGSTESAVGETQIPELKETAQVMMKKGSSFTLTSAGSASELQLTAAYQMTASAASVWEGCKLGLVVQPENGVKIPNDVRLEVSETGGSTTVYPANRNGQYLVPLNEITANSASRDLTLRWVSDTFCYEKDAVTYPVNVELYASASVDTDAAFKGKKVAELKNLSLKRDAEKLPSVKINTEKRLYQKGGEMNLEIKYENVDKVEASIWKKNAEGEYTNTAFKQVLKSSGSSNQFSLAGQDAGSYCLKITVSKTEGDSIRTIMEVPYYFIIVDESQGNAS